MLSENLKNILATFLLLWLGFLIIMVLWELRFMLLYMTFAGTIIVGFIWAFHRMVL